MPKLDLLSEVDKDTIYFDGLTKIENEMKTISKNHRIVIFIDDLDRCNSKKALEVFESTKIFLDLEGFIFIIGLNHETLYKLIEEKFKNIAVKGEEYIRKIIQIYINMPSWKISDISKLYNNILMKLGEENTILDNPEIIELMVLAVGSNPRETKRLVNKYIINKSINQQLEFLDFLISQLLETQYKELYQDLNTDYNFRNEFINLFKLESGKLNMYLNAIKEEQSLNSTQKKILNINPETWSFLNKYRDHIIKILNEWEIYKEIFPSVDPIETIRRTVIKEFITDLTSIINRINPTLDKNSNIPLLKEIETLRTKLYNKRFNTLHEETIRELGLLIQDILNDLDKDSHEFINKKEELFKYLNEFKDIEAKRK
jgi:predicted KAP-like P-loop ATPase